MLDVQVLETLATSPTVQTTVALLLFSIVVQWYFNLPPNPKFPEADLDEGDWHGSLMKAKSKVKLSTRGYRGPPASSAPHRSPGLG